MNTEEKIKALEKDLNLLFDSNSINDIESIKANLRSEWDESKKDEDLLARAIKVVNRDDNKQATEIFSPTIASLILLDYEYINPLIYEVLINIIYNSPSISCLSNFFTAPYNYTFLTITLFNPNLSLNEEQLNFLFQQILKDYELIDKSLNVLSRLDARFNTVYLDVSLSNAMISQERDKYSNDIENEIINFVNYVYQKNSNPHFRNAPANIKYFILNHPIISKLANSDKWKSCFRKLFLSQKWDEHNFYLEKLNKSYNCYRNEEKDMSINYKLFLEDAEERVKIKRFIKMPF